MKLFLPYFMLCCLAAFAIVYVYVVPNHIEINDTSRPRRIPFSKDNINRTIDLNHTSSLYSFQLSNNEPFVSGDFFRQISDHILNSTEALWKFSANPTVSRGDIIFLKTDYQYDFENIFPKIKARFILITHDSDYSAYNKEILKSPKLIRWYALNKDFDHELLTAIPIGLANTKWQHGNQKLVVEAQKNIIPFENRTIQVFVNFRNTNPDRKLVWEQFCDKESEINATCKEIVKTQQEYLDIVSNTQFVISPLGNGIDCHRTWESIALGAIPVVLNSTIRELYEGERVLIVNDFKELTPELLEEATERFQSVQNTADTSRLYKTYWLQQFKEEIEGI